MNLVKMKKVILKMKRKMKMNQKIRKINKVEKCFQI